MVNIIKDDSMFHPKAFHLEVWWSEFDRSMKFLNFEKVLITYGTNKSYSHNMIKRLRLQVLDKYRLHRLCLLLKTELYLKLEMEIVKIFSWSWLQS